MGNSHAEQFFMSMKDAKGALGWLEYNILKMDEALKEPSTSSGSLSVEYSTFNLLTSLVCAIEWYEKEYLEELECEERKNLTTVFDALKHFQLTYKKHDEPLKNLSVTSMHISESSASHYTPVLIKKNEAQPKTFLSISIAWHTKLKDKIDGK